MDMQPEEQLLAAMIRLAIRDAKGKEERIRAEAAWWLWWVAPSVAERAGVPDVAIAIAGGHREVG